MIKLILSIALVLGGALFSTLLHLTGFTFYVIPLGFLFLFLSGKGK
jgi:uncharacterized membrane protein